MFRKKTHPQTPHSTDNKIENKRLKTTMHQKKRKKKLQAQLKYEICWVKVPGKLWPLVEQQDMFTRVKLSTTYQEIPLLHYLQVWLNSAKVDGTIS